MTGSVGAIKYTDGVLDAVVAGSGPNGLAAAIVLARAGKSVRVLESADTIGGGTRTAEVTLPGFLHDVCSGVHPMGQLSPFFRSLPIEMPWVPAPVSVAHPLDGPHGDDAVILDRSGEGFGGSGQRLMRSLIRDSLWSDLLGPLRPRLRMARFGRLGFSSAVAFAKRLPDARARALFAGCAAHAALPLEKRITAAVGLVFSVSAMMVDWACAKGGSSSITDALAAHLLSLGGEIETGVRVTSLSALPEARVVLLAVSHQQVDTIAGDALPDGFRKRLRRHRYGPGAFKLDWALDGPIPWRDPRVAQASTVHIGGTMEEIAASERDAWEGRICERPFLIVTQQSHFDSSRAPDGKHTGYAYCHVPSGCDVDMTDRIEAQVERFAPGFSDIILARHATSPAAFQDYNQNYVGGAITGGAGDLRQLLFRPGHVTPNPRIFLCSASTPPGGGVHGMCGVHAARAVLKRRLR